MDGRKRLDYFWPCIAIGGTLWKKGEVGAEKGKISATKRFLIKFYLAALVSLSNPPPFPLPKKKHNFLIQNSMHLCMNRENRVEMSVKDESVRDHGLFLLTQSGNVHTMSHYSSADCFCQERYTPVQLGKHLQQKRFLHFFSWFLRTLLWLFPGLIN